MTEKRRPPLGSLRVFVAAAQAVLYRGAGLEVIWPQALALLAIGSALFAFSLSRFRRTLGQMG